MFQDARVQRHRQPEEREAHPGPVPHAAPDAPAALHRERLQVGRPQVR